MLSKNRSYRVVAWRCSRQVFFTASTSPLTRRASGRSPLAKVGVEWPVYARHGHELMGWKSPVGGHYGIRITTSRGQGQHREALSEGSPSAKVRTDEQKSHRRLSSGASQHHVTKPAMSGGRVNAAVVHRRRMFLFGESCATCGPCDYGSRTEAHVEKHGLAIGP